MNGFQNKIAKVCTADGRIVMLVEPLYFLAQDGTTFCIPQGAESDGIPSPPEIWPVRPPFGKDWLAGVLHDAAYRDTLLVVETSLSGFTSTHKASLPKAQCDLLLREAALSLGDTDAEADALYYGVKDFGWRSFDGDRA